MAAPDRERFAAAHRLFLAAVELSGEEREAFFARECGGDAELRAEVLGLLEEERAGDRRLEQPAAAALLRAELGTTLPERIGDFRILGLLGAGGAGIVYEAEQVHPRRAVALKLIRSPFATDEERRRFEHEAQALAWLNHPGIAAIYATGTADAGLGPQPYLAMELVRGERLDEHARSRELDLRARLELVARLCDAVHHAHQKGVIHRDLKPGNVLVDSCGQPKVLDFGVARITNADIEATTRRTGAGEILGTLPYMSPEQVRADPALVDSRSDVYALGVIAYELVAGRRPHEVSSQALARAFQTIVHEEPTGLGTIDRRLRGDVETIVHKAIAKEKERRYDSAAELAADIRRYLASEPILARPASRSYQLRKFARRNRVLVAGIAAVFLALLAGSITSTLLFLEKEEQRAAAEERGQALEAALRSANENLERALEAEELARDEEARAQLEAGTAQAVTDYLVTLFEYANPEGGSRQVTALDLLDRGVERIRGELADRPVIRARLLNVFGKIYNWLQRYERSHPILEEALALTAELHGEDSAEYADTLERLAQVHLEAGDLARAETMQRQVLALREKHLGRAHLLCTDALNNLGNTLTTAGRYEEAERLLSEARATRVDRLGEDALEVALLDHNFGVLLTYQGRDAEAELSIRRSLSGMQAHLGEDHWRTLTCRSSLADCLRTRNKSEEALEHARAAYRGLGSLFGEDSLMTKRALRLYAACLREGGEPGEAARILEDLLAQRGESAPRDADYGYLLQNLASTLHDLERFDEAETFYLDALDVYAALGNDQRDQILEVRHNLAYLYSQTGRLDEALALELEVLAQRERWLGLAHPASRSSLNNLAEIYRALSRPDDEEAVRRRKLAAAEGELGAGDPVAQDARVELAEFLRRAGRDGEAEDLLGGTRRD